ncbi:MAG: YgiQ family radical SAM protein, partial [Anaerovoracaceae bacterium]
MFLPISKSDMKEREWSQCDFILITGDAYVDHPSFGAAIISRLLERYGYKVGIISQPGWKNLDDIRTLGEPRLGFLVTAGNVDSMVNHYTAFKRPRSDDAYSPNGKGGKRPDRAASVYTKMAKSAYPDTPVILGGLEASLRRMAHYDYWDDEIKPSILIESEADLLVYGMGEKAILEIAEALDSGINISDITWIKGTVIKTLNILRAEEKATSSIGNEILLPTYNEIIKNRKLFAESFLIQYRNNDHITAKTLIEEYLDLGISITQNPPQPPLEGMDLDDVYDLPYERNYHPSYEKLSGDTKVNSDKAAVPAIEEVKFSIIANRGCFGSCSFCALTFNQGRQVRGRSKESILKEAKIITEMPDFKGYIHDVGGPTANFHSASCENQKKVGVCKNKDCLFPKPCKSMKVDHKDYFEI